ncbi:MAG: sugar porter family MFS transporter [Pirellulales bacterium]|nr:sugar porter family MFS transporter [Pirellulales bacterium]
MVGKGYLVRSTIIAALGGLLFGFDTAVISGTTDWLKKVYALGPFWLGFTVAAALIGTIVGAVVAGRPADQYGRRTTLVAVAVLYFVSAVGSALAWDWYSFLFFRFIGGIGVGGASVVSPMYIAEISPARLRGRLVAVTQFNIVLGILLAFFSNFVIARIDPGSAQWRWMFGVEAVPAAAFFFLLFVTPRSPRWLVLKGRLDEARWVLDRLGTDAGSVDQEIREIQTSVATAHHTLEEPFFRRAYRKPILLAIAIAAFNQLSGINALMYYAPHIFRMAGAGEDSALLQTVAVGGTNLVLTMAAMAVIDHFGRRRLMLIGSIGYILSLGATAWAFYANAAEFRAAAAAAEALDKAREAGNQVAIQTALDASSAAVAAAGAGGTVVLVSLLVFIASHAVGQGAVIWVFLSEIFPNQVRARGQALGSFTHWVMAAAISWTFPLIADWSGGHAFAFYCAMMVLQLLWVLTVMPETKGVPLEKIQRELGIE